MQFQKAERKKSKLRLALTGPSGSGKTYGALLLASGLSSKIAVIDTEQGSASLYSHLVDFDSLELTPPYTPERYKQALKLAIESGYEVVIIDSITHEWSGTGGCLELLESTAKAKYRGNTWAAWNDITPRHRSFIDDMLTAPIHVIVTARSKTETAQVDVNGKKQVQKLGMKTEQREGIEYEFTTVLDIIHDGHFATPSKDRTGIFNSSDPIVLSKEVGERIKKWLDSGVELKTPPKSESQNNSELSTQQNMSSTQTNTQIKKSFNEIVNERLDKCKSKDELESLYDQFLKWVEDKHPDKVDEFNIMYNDKVLSFM
ncbi:TPA: ATP-binding protein [Pasteurella multocida]|nr:ATP-binding protein [Pasteurella multocida]HDR1409878.1 ATP-binding protein [Pasteurella multocida]HDR1605749.1 ATP-binding protein [Pasteurella multocida]